MLSRKKQLAVWLIWLAIWPTVMILLFNYEFVNASFRLSDLLVFIILTSMVAYLPITINKTPIFLINSVSLATFLIFGLFGEIIITQLAVMSVIVRLKITRTEHYRIPLNLLLFLGVSIVSAFVYYSLAPFTSKQFVILDQNILQLFAYVFTSFVANQVMLYYVKRYYYKIKAPLLNEGFYFSLLSISYTLPTGILIVYLHQIFGPAGVLMMSVQIVAISIAIKLYYKSKKTTENLQNVNQIAQKLTGHLSREGVVDTYLNMLPERFAIETMMLYDIVDQDKLQLIHFYKNGKIMQTSQELIEMKELTIVERVFKREKLLYYDKAKQWKHYLLPELQNQGESLVAMPIKRNQQITAILIIVDNKRYTFDESLLSTFTVLNSYFGIALENSKYYENMRADSQTDHLTNLPNLRSFENFIRDYQEKLETSINLTLNCSLLMIDIDHFKYVNDQYGHESGNEVLIQIADLMHLFFDDMGEVFRYGGEEFLVFLPNYSHESSVNVAESFRKLVEQNEFTSHNYMVENHPTISLDLTVSIGVASYPKETEDINALIRLADRAMYLGAKRSGRNKVGVYQQ
ncbi:sensor domain-containing diguanylate cyclase [Amphibacillus indicireducens]|uniref:GGDEF domain-containing protein n=1 Tax=Amphibacillus indicireducens TaxID=1076330 RepID=A0ABP7VGB3_9BACI